MGYYKTIQKTFMHKSIKITKNNKISVRDLDDLWVGFCPCKSTFLVNFTYLNRFYLVEATGGEQRKE